VDEVQFTSNDTMPERQPRRGSDQRAKDYFIATTTFQSNGWRGCYQTRNMRAYDVLHIDRYRQYAERGKLFSLATWLPRTRQRDARCAGQTYIDLYLLDPQPIRIAGGAGWD